MMSRRLNRRRLLPADLHETGPDVPDNAALIYRTFGLPESSLQLEQTELPPLAENRARVRMILAPINPSDLIPITGAYRHRTSLPMIAGYEGVGVVCEAFGRAAPLVGRRVLPLRGPGTWQTYIDCDPDRLILVPDDISDDIAARAYINPMAALTMLNTWPVRGKAVLLTGAGSCCANLLAEWALHQGAASIVGVYRDESHRSPLHALGVQALPLDAEPAIAAAAQGADLVFDALGGPIASLILASVRHDAPVVGYGLLSGTPVVSGPAGGSLQRFHLRDTLRDLSDQEWRRRFAELWPLLRADTMGAVRRFHLMEWQAALAYFRQSGRREKPALAFG